MNKIRLIIIGICLMMATKAFAGDFVCEEGTSISKRISCGKSCSVNPKCIRVIRETSIINKKLVDGKLLSLTQIELDAIAAAKALAQAEYDKVITLEKLVAVLEDKEVLTKTEVETKEILDVKEISR